MSKSAFRAALVAAALCLAAAPLHAKDTSAATAAPAEGQTYANLLTVLIDSSKTVLDQPFAYPASPAHITAAIVEIPPGGETGWHDHEVPLVAYILEGALTVDYGEKGTKVYEAGSAVVEAINWPHIGRNKGDVPMRLFAVYMGAEGLKNTIPLPNHAE